MKIKLTNGPSVELHQQLNLQYKTKLYVAGYEHHSVFPATMGGLDFKSYDFGNGLNFHIIKGDILKLLEWSFEDNHRHILRYVFVKQGELILRLAKNVRYKLASGYSTIVSASTDHELLMTFPVQNGFEMFIIEIMTQRFSMGKQTELLGLPQELSDVFLNRQTNEHFIYQSSYLLSIAETYNEISSTKAEGIVKRFFLESKVLELLWLQTEQYRHEMLFGYDEQVLRKSDIIILKQAKDYIHQNLAKELTLSVLARAVGTNETKLKLGFKKMFGKTFSEILRNERFQQARLLVEEGELGIKEVSLKCGYQSTSMFRMRFKEHFGVSPSQYQKARLVENHA